MPQYLSPGVYVEEVPSAVKAIAGVGTSTAGFIGIVPENLSPAVPLDRVENEAVGTGDGTKTSFKLKRAATDTTAVTVMVNGAALPGTPSVTNEGGSSQVVFPSAPAAGAVITASYTPTAPPPVVDEAVGTGDGSQTTFSLQRKATSAASVTVKVNGQATDATAAQQNKGTQITFGAAPAAGAVITASYTPAAPAAAVGEAVGTGNGVTKTFRLKQSPVNTTTAKVLIGGAEPLSATAANTSGGTEITFTTAPPSGAVITASYVPAFVPVAAGVVKLCTNFTEFKKFFGDFSNNANHSNLAHAVYGFFNNGGSRCYVSRLAPGANSDAVPDIAPVLTAFEAIEEIAIVAAPGLTDRNSRAALTAHCTLTKSRFAILDTPQDVGTGDALDLTKFSNPTAADSAAPPNSNYAAVYFPWIQVFDPATTTGDRTRFVPPSGHVAGVYARVDAERGVHKAPANETVLGALGLRYALSKNQQDGLNPKGVNCIRALNGNIRIWGARTAGGDDNADLKYVNVRRTLIYLRGSIEAGTQWVVFEPNTPALWQKISRNVTAFLTNVWRAGALFGNTAAEAFYVKCDAENNPPEVRELGQVVTEVGVAIVRPAEFVIFRISQFSAPGK